ncbi:UPF0147 family protein [Candidatus Woesearchaeota archaeon]|nr:UPF0147 family protein [Candidatus Woesearchaeota archaeon]
METLIEELNAILDDESMPKNVRSKIEVAICALQDCSVEESLRANKAIQELDDVSDDPNMPSYVRSQLWTIISQLETL